MTRRIALLMSSALTVFVLVLGVGIAAWLHAPGTDAAASSAAEQMALSPPPSRPEQVGPAVQSRPEAPGRAERATAQSAGAGPRAESAGPAGDPAAANEGPRLAASPTISSPSGSLIQSSAGEEAPHTPTKVKRAASHDDHAAATAPASSHARTGHHDD